VKTYSVFHQPTIDHLPNLTVQSNEDYFILPMAHICAIGRPYFFNEEVRSVCLLINLRVSQNYD